MVGVRSCEDTRVSVSQFRTPNAMKQTEQESAKIAKVKKTPKPVDAAAVPVTEKSKKRGHRSGAVAAMQVKRQSKSSAPIFFEKVVARMFKDVSPKGMRVTRRAVHVLRSILEHENVSFGADAYAVTKLRCAKGSKNVRAKLRDAELINKLKPLVA